MILQLFVRVRIKPLTEILCRPLWSGDGEEKSTNKLVRTGIFLSRGVDAFVFVTILSTLFTWVRWSHTHCNGNAMVLIWTVKLVRRLSLTVLRQGISAHMLVSSKLPQAKRDGASGLYKSHHRCIGISRLTISVD